MKWRTNNKVVEQEQKRTLVSVSDNTGPKQEIDKEVKRSRLDYTSRQ